MFSCVRYSVVYDVVLLLVYSFFFFFKQKTAYDMRISDWSSDVCSSDLKKRYSLLADATHPSPDPRKNTSLPHPGASHPQCGTTGLATPRRSFPACPDTRKRRSPARADAPATRPVRHPPPFRRFPDRPALPRTTGRQDHPMRQRDAGRAHVCTPVTNAHLVCRLLLENKKTNTINHHTTEHLNSTATPCLI